MKKAFSLLELSIAVMIIALLLVGTLQGNKLIKKSRLTTAQTLTKNSIVNELDGVAAWFETSLESSFSNISEDGTSIATWFDNNPNAVVKNNATNSTSSQRPKFYSSVFYGSIPAVRFDGSDDSLSFDGSSLINSAYTIFVVEQRRNSNSQNYFIGGSSLSSNGNLYLGYKTNTSLTQGHYSNDMDMVVSGYSATNLTTKIHTFAFDNSNGKSYWLNGAASVTASSSGQTSPLTSYTGSRIGLYSSSYFNGDLAEIIIFKRNLKDVERKAVEEYLGKKFNIATNL